MNPFLMEIDPAYMIEEPYVPVVRRYLTSAARRVGLDVQEDAGIFIFSRSKRLYRGRHRRDILASGMAENDDISL